MMRGKSIKEMSDIPIFKGMSDQEATEKFAEMLFAYKIIDNPGNYRDMPGVGPGALSSQLIGPRFAKADKLIGTNPKNLFNEKTFVGQRSRQTPVAKARREEMGRVEKATSAVRDAYKKFVNVSQNVGDVVEIQHRAGGMLALLRKGYSPDEAANVVKLLQVDYSNLSTFEREYLRRMFPFYSFSRGMAKYLAEELTTNPAGPVGQTLRVQRNARDRDVATPTYINKGVSIPFGSNADGTRHFLTNLGLMHEQPAQQLSPLFALNPQDSFFTIGSNLNPLLKAPLEIMFDESTFQQGVSGGVDLDDADPPLGRALSNIGQTVGLRDKDRKEPIRLGKLTEVAVGSSPLSRYVNTTRTIFDPRKNVLMSGANSLTGLRISSVSPQRQDAVLRERAEQYLQDVGARQFRKSYIPDEVRASLSKEELESVEQYEQLIELISQRNKERRKKKEQQSGR